MAPMLVPMVIIVLSYFQPQLMAVGLPLVLLFGGALCLMHPGTITDLIGLGIGAPLYAWQRLRARLNHG